MQRCNTQTFNNVLKPTGIPNLVYLSFIQFIFDFEFNLNITEKVMSKRNVVFYLCKAHPSNGFVFLNCRLQVVVVVIFSIIVMQFIHFLLKMFFFYSFSIHRFAIFSSLQFFFSALNLIIEFMIEYNHSFVGSTLNLICVSAKYGKSFMEKLWRA